MGKDWSGRGLGTRVRAGGKRRGHGVRSFGGVGVHGERVEEDGAEVAA